jgi:hypothetical protein
LCQAFPQIGIVCSRYTEELDTARLEPSYGSHDVVRAEGYVLDSGAVVVVDESVMVRRVVCGWSRRYEREERREESGTRGGFHTPQSATSSCLLQVHS